MRKLYICNEHSMVNMISLKRVVYFVDDATSDEDTYMSIKDISTYFTDEDCDHKTVINRINSQIYNNRNLFTVKKIKGKVFWRLSANGYRYLNKFKDSYDPITDKLLFQPERIEVL